MEIFATANKNKYRYQFKGFITTEDLWDLSLDNLDSIFKSLNSQLKTAKEESLLSTPSKADEELRNKIEIVKFIVANKLQQIQEREQARANAEQKQRVLEAISNKENAAINNMSLEDLKKMLDNM